MPRYYTRQPSKKKFQRRKVDKAIHGWNDVKSSDMLGQVYVIHPNNQECFYSRLPLHIVHGPTSFADLKTHNGEVCETFRLAYQCRGLLESNEHWDLALMEASASQSPRKICSLFATIISQCHVSAPKDLYLRHRENMAEDILHHTQLRDSTAGIAFNDVIFNEALCQVDELTMQMVGKSIDRLGLKLPQRDGSRNMAREVLRDQSYDTETLRAFFNENKPKLNEKQKTAFGTLQSTLRLQHLRHACRGPPMDGAIFFLEAPGGTGKTFLITVLLAMVHGQRDEITIAVASSGIATTLMPGGRMAHLAFKLQGQRCG